MRPWSKLDRSICQILHHTYLAIASSSNSCYRHHVRLNYHVNQFSGHSHNCGVRVDWERFPSDDFVFGTMIALADSHVEKYVNSGKQQSVRWTQPANTYMPYRGISHDRREPKPRHIRQDWMTTRKGLDEQVGEHFAEYPPGSVEICTADFMGATVQQELEMEEFEFEEHHWRPAPVPSPKTPKPPPKAPKTPTREHGPDSLPDYITPPDVTPGQLVAGRAVMRQRGTRLSARLGPESHQSYKRYHVQEMRRRGREMGLM